MGVPYRITEDGLALLQQGGDVENPAHWWRVVQFEWNAVTGFPELKVGPADAPTTFTRDASGTPKMQATDTSGTTLPVLRQQSGTVSVNASKDVRINFEQPFAKVPRVTVILDQSATSQPWRINVTKTFADLKMSNPYTGMVDFVALEPAD